SLINFFFFQAEDGIRDRNVTGVQTCALPIFSGISCRNSRPTRLSRRRFDTPSAAAAVRLASTIRRSETLVSSTASLESSITSRRSEERRVGKEWRVVGRPDQ